MKYGDCLKEHREKRNLSQNELSKQCGISQQMISYWENNNGLPSIDFCVKLADFYGISLDELVGREFGHND